VSSERVRQIEMRAFEKIKKAVKDNIARLEQPDASVEAQVNSTPAPRLHDWSKYQSGRHMPISSPDNDERAFAGASAA
jgi:hypothetical protein